MDARYEVLFNFHAQGDGEMSVVQGETVVMVPGEDGIFGTEDDVKDGWILVESTITPGNVGYVPVTYVKKVEEVEQVEEVEVTTATTATPTTTDNVHNRVPFASQNGHQTDLEPDLITPNSTAQSLASLLSADEPVAEPVEAVPTEAMPPTFRRLSDPRLAAHLTKLEQRVKASLTATATPEPTSEPASRIKSAPPASKSTSTSSPRYGSTWARLREKAPIIAAGSDAGVSKLFSVVRTAAATSGKAFRTPSLRAAVDSDDPEELAKLQADAYL